MFLNQNALKRLCKQAYKNWGLHIEHTLDGYIAIGSTSWTLEIMDDKLPNGIKACLIEMVGDLPPAGTGYKYHKKEMPQSELPNVTYKGLEAMFDRMKEDYVETKVRLKHEGDWLSVLQSVTTGGKIMVNDTFIEMIDESEIDREGGECEPGYPRANNLNVIWSNNVMSFMCWRRSVKYTKEEYFMDTIDALDLAYNFEEEELL